MRIIIKGLIDKPKLKKNITLIFSLILTLTFSFYTFYYFDLKKTENNEKIENRTLYFKTNASEKSLLKGFDDKIESQEINDSEDYSFVVFKTRDDLESFSLTKKDSLKDIVVNVTTTGQLENNMSIIFQIVIIVTEILLVTLSIIFNLNYILNVKEEIFLYHVLGYKRPNTIGIIYIFLLFLSCIAICTLTFINYLICLITNLPIFIITSVIKANIISIIITNILSYIISIIYISSHNLNSLK